MKTWLRLLLITLTVGGGFTGLALSLQPMFEGKISEPALKVLLLAFAGAYVFVIVSGLLLVINPRRTWPVMIALLLQVPVFSSPIIAYRFSAGFHVTVSIIGGNLSAGFQLGSHWQFNLFQNVPWGIGINLFALCLLVVVARVHERTHAAGSSVPAEGMPKETT
jgi:hypothetical protein